MYVYDHWYILQLDYITILFDMNKCTGEHRVSNQACDPGPPTYSCRDKQGSLPSGFSFCNWLYDYLWSEV